MSEIELHLPELWPHQQRFVDDGHQFAVCKSATKCGKTTAGAWWIVREAANHPGTLWWWIGPTQDVGLIGYQTIRFLATDELIERKWERPYKMKLVNGSSIALKSAQDPDHLQGAGVNGAVLDEAGLPEYDKAWPNIRTTLSATHGRAKIIGNPGDGGSFFDKAEMWGMDEAMPEWSYHRWAFLDRPTASAEDLEQAKRELGEDSPEFRRFFLGETIRGEGAFFYGLDKVATAEPEEAKPGQRYTIGVDCCGIGAQSDFFVATVFHEEQKRQVSYTRHKGAPSEVQADEIARLAKEYNDAVVMVETNGPGGPIYQAVHGRGAQVYPFSTQQKSKMEILYDYRADISQKRIRLLKDDYQMREHLQFQRRRTGMNQERLAAPAGGHDDLVMANAIAAHAMRKVVTPELVWVS